MVFSFEKNIIIKKKKNYLQTQKFRKYKLTDNQQEEFKKNGFIILKNILRKEEIKSFKKEIWDTIFKIPYSEDLKKNDFDDYDKELNQEDIDNLNKFYPNIDKFGTMNLPPFFHLHHMWKNRQNPNIFVKFAQLLDNHKIWTTLDRVSVKLPGKGNTEFCHWDSDPWFWDKQEYEPLQGILSLSDTSFFCSPGTHTLEFSKKFQENYEYLKPKNNKKRDYISLKKNYPDPLNLCDSIKEYKLNQGDLLIFSNRLLHESRQNKSNKIRYVQYISFEPARNNQNRYKNKIEEKYIKNNISEVKDRIESFLTGKNPLYLPSGCNMNMFSNNYITFHSDLLNTFSNRFNKILLKTYRYKSGKNKDKEIQIIHNYDSSQIILDNNEPFYKPFKLNFYGKRILGLKNW